jgi:hypothetical protein
MLAPFSPPPTRDRGLACFSPDVNPTPESESPEPALARLCYSCCLGMQQ